MSLWTDFDLDEPDGSTEDGPGVIAAIQANQHALWNHIMMGSVKDMLFSVSGGTALQPANIFFGNGTNILKAAITWGSAGGANGNFQSITWSVSQDNGSTYSTVCTQSFTYDSSGNLTATSGAGGMLAFVAYLLGRSKLLRTDITSIQGTLATLQGMAFQDPSSIAVTGGTLKGVDIGGTGTGEAKKLTALFTREKVVDLGGGTPANTFTIDFNAGGVFLCAPGNNFTFAFTNVPSAGFAQKVVIELTNGAPWTCTLPSGAHWSADTPPTFSGGVDLISLYYRGHASTPTARFMLSSAGF